MKKASASHLSGRRLSDACSSAMVKEVPMERCAKSGPASAGGPPRRLRGSGIAAAQPPFELVRRLADRHVGT